jgi:hypothetical protein
VAKHVHEAVDAVRKAEHRALKQAGDERLTGTSLRARRDQLLPERHRVDRARQAHPEGRDWFFSLHVPRSLLGDL